MKHDPTLPFMPVGDAPRLLARLPMVLKMTKLVPSNLANAIAIGGGVVTLLDVFKTYIAPNVPGLHAYEQLSEYRTLPLATGMAGMDEAYGDSAYV